MQLQSLSNALIKRSQSSSALPDIIVFSHLRWEFVKQRPQQLLERFAKDQKILFVEEPISTEGYPRFSANSIEVNDQITVLQPRISTEDWSELAAIINRNYSLNSDEPILWFYSAAFLPMIDELEYSLLVYDCMDELSAFKGAPASLRAQEKKLLSLADVVFTGGKSLHESKRKFNSNTYCFPSSVDSKHFEKAEKKKTALPADVADITKPIVGFYGVIDERIDLELLKNVALSTPDAAFVMIGPVVKINPEDLPTADNIYYLGPKNYEELPAYLKAFNVAMMPFALNESTEFISPTKTLEFMAAKKPIISTAIKDVKREYRKEVAIVSSTEAFVTAIQRYLNESPSELRNREKLQSDVIEKTSWDATVQAMQKILRKSLTEVQEMTPVATYTPSGAVSLQLNFST